MCHGYTTAATVNYSPCAPEMPVTALDFMPHHRESSRFEPEPEITEEEWEATALRQQEMLQLSVEMKTQCGPLYERICLGKNDG